MPNNLDHNAGVHTHIFDRVFEDVALRHGQEASVQCQGQIAVGAVDGLMNRHQLRAVAECRFNLNLSYHAGNAWLHLVVTCMALCRLMIRAELQDWE